jgi:hypothetical protein
MGTATATEAATLDWGGNDEPTSPPSLSGLGFAKVKAGGSPVLIATLSISAPAWKQGESDTTPGVAAGPFTSFAPGSKKVKANKQFVLLEGDKSAGVVVTWANKPPEVAARTATIVCTLKKAGQTEVTAN